MEPVTSTFIGEGALQDFEGSPGCMGLVTVVKGCRLTPGGDWVYPGWELYAETRPKGRREDEDVLLPHVENLAGKWGVVLVIAALKALGWEIKGGGGPGLVRRECQCRSPRLQPEGVRQVEERQEPGKGEATDVVRYPGGGAA